MTLVAVENLRVSFDTEDGELVAVDDLSFSVDVAETFGIVGESGSGKSVSTQAIVGLVPGAGVSGRAMFDGQDLIGMAPSQLRRIRGARIGLVFQDPLSSLHPYFRVGQQIVEAIRAHERMSADVAKDRAVELLARVGLGQPDRRFHEFPHQFSGGMRQRAMIAIAVALRPALIIADEPTTALDVTVQAQVVELLKELKTEFGTSIIMITHDLGVIAGMADRVMTMYAGRMVETAPRREIYYRPHHPYTRGLLDSVPGNNPTGVPLHTIKGQPPSLLALGPGCVFRSRCDHAMPECGEDPPLRTIGDRHRSLCWLPPVAEQRMAHAPDPTPGATPGATTGGAVNSGEILLRVTDVVKHFPIRDGWFGRGHDVVHAVDGVSFEVRQGETFGIVGESGCGKSTLARVVTGLLRATSGRVDLTGRELTALTESELRPVRRDVQMIFQDPYGSLNPRRRVGSIIGEPFHIHGIEHDERSIRRQVQELMELVGLNPEHYNRFPAEFSGGQRQRIGVARALATRPKLVVCDEPVSALDVSIQAQIINLLKRLQRELALTYVFIGHDLSVVRHISDRVAVMYLGRMVETGPTEQLFARPTHPYTYALLAAAPIADPDATDARTRRPLPGEVPSPVHPPHGCRFNPRCDRVQERCRSEIPALETIDDAQSGSSRVACFFPIVTVRNQEH